MNSNENIERLISSYKRAEEYYIYRIKNIQEFLNKHTFKVFDNTQSNIFSNKGYDCTGNGNCFSNIPGTYDYIKVRNNCNCQLVKCPNFILCQHYIIPFEHANYYGLCYPCSIEYKLCGKGKGVLKTFESHKCNYCNKIEVCIEHPKCDNKLCYNCFKINEAK